MIVTYKQANKINYPIFELPNDNWWTKDGLMYVDNFLIDDKNVKKKTLGARRLSSSMRDFFPLKYIKFNYRELIVSNHKYYIDNTGIPFIYEKTQFFHVVYYKIKTIQKRQTYSVLWVHGVNFGFELARPPSTKYRFAGIMHYKKLPWFLYNFSIDKQKDKVRKV